MKLLIRCHDGETFLLDPVQFDSDFVSGVDRDGLVKVIDKADIQSCVEVNEDESRTVRRSLP